ncbi:related to tetracenomycin polyketide synthesis hydroxylase tcmG [Rhynchosporium agropyri]|uniref:Related to tetracenomycin polyketide synthesis hydroxylase tcmG n=1 Tax=Rhynchosporium agropyri TaxID=914238 RepID=A0A1E1LI18_9HELO|nr:related to tetracenomycin polyketide synthesis hydroxylase tcmG [Rhynchosporium agropyri]
MGYVSGRSLYAAISPQARHSPTKRTLKSLPFASVLATMGPVPGQFISLETLEPVLLSTLRDRGVETRFSTACKSISRNSSIVTAKLRNKENAEEYEMTADYLIAADGANSPIRTQLNIPLSEDKPESGHLLNIYLRASLGEFVQNREFSLGKVHREASSLLECTIDGLFTSINNSDRWVFHLSYDPAAGEKATDFTHEICAEIVSRALGMDESPSGPVEIEILSVLPWQASARVAQRMQEGRIFLAGDSAHQMPPYAGQGANTGIADGHNLAWKLAAVLTSSSNSGSNGSKTIIPALLRTYEKERLPIDTYAASVSGASADSKGLFALKPNLTSAITLVQRCFLVAGLSVWYQGPGVGVIPENLGLLRGASWRAWSFSGLVMGIDGRPGRRAPHLWLQKRADISEANKGTDVAQKVTRISTLDLFGRHFILLTGSEGREWIKAAQNVSSKLLACGLEFETYVIGGDEDHDYIPVDGRSAFETAAGISNTGALLVRPDGFVAWRERRIPDKCGERLEEVMIRLLCL